MEWYLTRVKLEFLVVPHPACPCEVELTAPETTLLGGIHLLPWVPQQFCFHRSSVAAHLSPRTSHGLSPMGCSGSCWVVQWSQMLIKRCMDEGTDKLWTSLGDGLNGKVYCH